MKAKEILKINCNDLEGDPREVLIINPTSVERSVWRTNYARNTGNSFEDIE